MRSVIFTPPRGVFIGFESPAREGLLELGKKFNLAKGRDFRVSVGRIQRHNILVVGSFIIGLDHDKAGIGKHVADVASQYGLDSLNTMFLTPLPGTRLWEQMKSEGRIALDHFPEDWKYYTLTFPVGRDKQLSLNGILEEMISCDRNFYSMPRILRRVWSNLWGCREPLIALQASATVLPSLTSTSVCRSFAITCSHVNVFFNPPGFLSVSSLSVRLVHKTPVRSAPGSQCSYCRGDHERILRVGVAVQRRNSPRCGQRCFTFPWPRGRLSANGGDRRLSRIPAGGGTHLRQSQVAQ